MEPNERGQDQRVALSGGHGLQVSKQMPEIPSKDTDLDAFIEWTDKVHRALTPIPNVADLLRHIHHVQDRTFQPR